MFHPAPTPNRNRPPDRRIEGCDLLRGDDRVALDHETDAGREQQRLGGNGGGRQPDEGVIRVAVLLGQLAAGRILRSPAHRDMGVLREEQRFKTALFDQPGDRRGIGGA